MQSMRISRFCFGTNIIKIRKFLMHQYLYAYKKSVVYHLYYRQITDKPTIFRWVFVSNLNPDGIFRRDS